MEFSSEIRKLEEQFWKNQPIYTIWGYEEDGSAAEELFSSENAEEVKAKMCDIIQNDYIYLYASFGISLGIPGALENFDFYTYTPHEEFDFDIETELLNMKNLLDCSTYTLYGFKENNLIKLFETQNFEKIKEKMKNIIANAVQSDTKSEYRYYFVCINDSPCYDFDPIEAYKRARKET